MSDRHLLPRFEGDIISHHKWTMAVPKSDWTCTTLSSLPVTVHHVNLLCILQITYNKGTSTSGLVIPCLQISTCVCYFFRTNRSTPAKWRWKNWRNKIQSCNAAIILSRLVVGRKSHVYYWLERSPLGTSSTVHVFIIWTDDYWYTYCVYPLILHNVRTFLCKKAIGFMHLAFLIHVACTDNNYCAFEMYESTSLVAWLPRGRYVNLC